MNNRFGTTSDMIIQTVQENDQTFCLAIDDGGLYLTTHIHLDKRIADPNRYTANRKTVQQRLQALGMDPVGLFNDNKHLIKKNRGEPARKINPLKASKRAMKSS